MEQIGVDAILSNVTALIPDQVPEQKRANTAALNGIAPVIGGVVGLILVTVFTNTQIVSQGYVVLAIVSILCVGFFLLVLREQPLQRSLLTPFHLRTFFASFVHPLQSPDFIFTLLSPLRSMHVLLASHHILYKKAGLRVSFLFSQEYASSGVRMNG